jgi:anti-sigma B factor antagonist
MMLQIEHRDAEPGAAVVSLTGKVMLGQESAKIEALVRQLVSGGRLNVVMDLAGVTHIDSTGIGRFIACLSQVRRAGGKLRMAAAGGQVREAFRVTRLDTVFQFDQDVESALKNLA